MDAMARDAYAYPFVHCIRLPGQFGGCFGNCKWPHRAPRCSIQEGLKPTVRPCEQIQAAGAHDVPMVRYGFEDEGRAAAPVVVLDDEGTADGPIVLSPWRGFLYVYSFFDSFYFV